MKKFIIYSVIVALLTTFVFYVCNECYPVACAYALVQSIILYAFKDTEIEGEKLL